MNNSWLQNSSANRLKQSYVQGFADISGNVIVRNGSVSIKTGKLLIPQGDISMNGNIICSGSISLGTTAGSGYQMTVNGNTRIKNSILVDNDASVMSSLGVGKAFDDAYHLDVSGATRISSALSVGGATTLGSITNVSGQSKFTGNVGIGANPDPDYALYAVGQVFATGRVSLNQSLTVGPDIDFEAEVQGAAVYVKVPLSSTAPNDVVMNVPNNLYTSIDSTNQSKTNKLEIDTKNHVIKPSIYNDGAPVSDSVNGWDLGATGANSFNRVYGRTLEVSQNVGIGKSSDAGYAMDVSGATRLSSSLVVGGAATLGTITNVTGTSKFTGSVGIGKAATSDIALDISGVTMVSGNTYIAKSLVIGNTSPSTATLHVNASANTAANSVVLEGANVLFKGQSSENLSHTNFLEIDTKTRSILPYAKDGSGATLNSMETGWNLGGAGANRFSKIYGRDLEISTNTIKIEDNSGNQISMSFDALTGAVNYTVTTISGEVFVIKGVQTQKVSSSGSGTIDPAMLEFTGLSFGDMFTISDAYNLANTFTYNLATTTYTGDGTTFASSSGAQTLTSFVTGTNLTTLLANVPTGTSVIINVGLTDGRAAHLEGIDVDGSLVSLTNKIISVKKTGASTSKWTLWNSDGYQNVAGNFLHYVELKNINMISGTYFIPKVPGTMTYNISDTQYMETTDLTAGNGDIYLYVNRGPGKNWTKVRVALPQAGTIQTQHMADSAITTAKLADASVTGTKLADGSILGSKITDGSLISSKIADSNVTTAKLADGAVTGAKLAGGVINAASLIADGIITGAKLASGAIIESAIGTESVTETKIGAGAVTTTKLADNSVTVNKLADGSVSSGKLAVDSIYNQHIAGGAVTTAKISDGSVTTEKIASGAITTAKLATGAITSGLLDASSVTMAKIASGAISTDKMAGFAVTAEKIASGAITEVKLADGSVTSAKFAAGSVTETKIIDNAITSAKILNYAVTADKIAGSAITSGKIADGSIFESKLGASVVTTDKLANLSVTSEKLADFAVTEYKIRDGSITFAKFAAGALSAGPVGPAGVDGTIGSTGPTGPVGIDGIAGTTGINGIAGTTGPAGIDGTAGTTGAVGTTGPAGSAAAGSSISTVSDISVNSIQVNGKTKTGIVYPLQVMIGTNATYGMIKNPFNSAMFGTFSDACQLNEYGDTFVTNISKSSVDYVNIYKVNSSTGLFTTPTTTILPDVSPCFLSMSADASVIAFGGGKDDSVNNKYNQFVYIIKTVNGVTTTRTLMHYTGVGISNTNIPIRSLKVTSDGTKLVVMTGRSTTTWGFSVYNISDNSFPLLVNIDLTSAFTWLVSGDPRRFSISGDGTKISFASNNSGPVTADNGRVIVYQVNYNVTSGTIPMDVTNNTNPSYGLTGYKPLLLSDLPARFRLKVNSNGYYVGIQNATSTTGTLYTYQGSAPTQGTYNAAIWTADQPVGLYSTTGTGTYRLKSVNHTWFGNSFPSTNFYMTSTSLGSNIVLNSTEALTISYVWQLFKNTTTGGIILWSPQTGTTGNYVTYNTSQTGDFLRINTGTPITFTIEPVFDFTSNNSSTKIGDFVGTATTGVNSKFGRTTTLSKDGSILAFATGDASPYSTGDSAVRIYSYISGTDWTLKQTILVSSITSKFPIYGLGSDIKFDSTYTKMIIGSWAYGQATPAAISTFIFNSGSWIHCANAHGSELNAATGWLVETFGLNISIDNTGRFVSSYGDSYPAGYGSAYIYQFARSELTSNLLYSNAGYFDNVVGISTRPIGGYALTIAGNVYSTGNNKIIGNTYVFSSSSATTSSTQLLSDGTISTVGNITSNGFSATNITGTNIIATTGLTSTNAISSPAGIVGTNARTVSLYTTIAGVTGTTIVQNSLNGPRTSSLASQSLSWDGNTLVVVSGTKILVYTRNSSTLVWNTTPTTITSSITISLVTMSADGTKIAITNGTTILIYVGGGSTWSLQTQTITDLSGKAYLTNFARNINLSSNGSTILIAAYTSAAVTGLYVYNTVSGAQLIEIDLSSGGTFPVNLLENGPYCHMAFSPNGNTIIAGRPSTTTPSNGLGSNLYVWDVNYSTSVVTRGYIQPTGGLLYMDLTGRGLSISSDGNVLAFVAGYSPEQNSYLYSARIMLCRRANNSSEWVVERTSYQMDILAPLGTNSTLSAYWIASGYGPTLGGNGSRTCVSGDGNTVVLCLGNYVAYTKYSNGAWSPYTLITGPTASSPYFGTSVVCDYTGNVITVTESITPGKVYIYYTGQVVTNILPITGKEVVIRTGPTETGQLYISSDGDVGIGSTAVSGTKLSVTGTITATGSITANSDDRLKENEELIVNATDTIMKLRPEYYSKKPTFDSTDITTWRKESGLIAQEVWYATPELRHLVTLGQDISGVTYEHEPATTTLVYNNDVSNNPIGELSSDPNYKMRIDTRYNNDVSNNPTGELNSDPNYNISKTIVPYVEPTEVTIPGKVITKPRYVPIDPANIINIPLTPDTDIQQDPDYKALGWGDTPSSLNYIGLIPYLIKSIQELKTEIDSQRSDIEQQKTYIQTLETRLNP